MANKFIDPFVYQFICQADAQTLENMRADLSREIEQGLLTDIGHKKELELINSRLQAA